MSSCSATAPRPSARPRRALVELAYARGVPLVATNEPFFATREDYEAHDALICIAEGRLVAESDRRQLTPEHRFKTRAEMVDAVRRPAGGARLDASRSRSAAPSGRAPASRSCRASRSASRAPRSTRRPNCASAPRPGSSAGSRARARAGPHRGGLPRAARLRARRHRGDEVSRLLPDRRRLHPVGEGAGHSGRARAAARAPARWSPMR